MLSLLNDRASITRVTALIRKCDGDKKTFEPDVICTGFSKGFRLLWSVPMIYFDIKNLLKAS